MKGENGDEMKKKTLLNSTLAKIIAFLLFAVGIAEGGMGVVGTLYLADEGYYKKSFEQIVHDRMVFSVWADVENLKEIYQEADPERARRDAEAYLQKRNLAVEVYVEDTLLWDLAPEESWDTSEESWDTPYHFMCYTTVCKELPVEELPDAEPESGEPSEEAADVPEDRARESGEPSEEVFDVPEDRAQENGEPSEEVFDTPEDRAQESGESSEEEPDAPADTRLVYQEMTFYVYVDPALKWKDVYWEAWKAVRDLNEYGMYGFPVAAAVGLSVALVCFLFLLWSAGHHPGREGISESLLSPYYFDLLTLLFGGVAFVGLVLLYSGASYTSGWGNYVLLGIFLMLESVWGMIWLRELALRMKLHILFQRTLAAGLLRGLKAAILGLPLVIPVMAVFAGISLVELAGIFLVGNGEVLLLWFLEKLLLFFPILYGALMCRRLQQGSEALAGGNLEYQVDTSAMLLGFRRHGENLNHIAQGMAAAVEQRMKSEHLKTELITNVSHDLKTPLTSIINYADLIGNLVTGIHSPGRLPGEEFSKIGGVVSEMPERLKGENGEKTLQTDAETAAEEAACAREGADAETAAKEAVCAWKGASTETAAKEAAYAREGADAETIVSEGDRQKLAEYAEALLRQSRRLKKLLDDLVEASKATTGNLEVHLQPCEMGVLLTQAVGEYEARFAEKGLELLVRQPENAVTVMADGRHIWRVFDNLLNNICKYAQENSRVYLTVEEQQGEASVIFRNISKYPLDLMGEELKERFVRGDKSRHMEGNGLGLSIAESLMELQGGSLELVTDGDLFKVTVRLSTVPGKDRT